MYLDVLKIDELASAAHMKPCTMVKGRALYKELCSVQMQCGEAKALWVGVGQWPVGLVMT